MGRRAALWTTLITGASIAGKADVSPVHSLSADARRTVDGAMLLRACARDHAHACTCTRARTRLKRMAVAEKREPAACSSASSSSSVVENLARAPRIPSASSPESVDSYESWSLASREINLIRDQRPVAEQTRAALSLKDTYMKQEAVFFFFFCETGPVAKSKRCALARMCALERVAQVCV